MGKKERKRVSLLVSLLQFTSFINYTHLSQDRACTTVANLSAHGSHRSSTFSCPRSFRKLSSRAATLSDSAIPDTELYTTLFLPSERNRKETKMLFTLNKYYFSSFSIFSSALSFLLPNSFVVYPKLNVVQAECDGRIYVVGESVIRPAEMSEI